MSVEITAPVPLEDRAVVHKALPHDSAARHVTGRALYVDDVPEATGTLHIAPVAAPIARGRITRLDLEAVRAAPGVVAVLTSADVPGVNDCSPVPFDTDPVFADGAIRFHGQVVAAVVAETRDAARRAARRAVVETEAETPAIDVDQADARGSRVMDDYAFARGDASAALDHAEVRASGTFLIGGQEHFYLEGQAALATPGEDGEMHVLSSTQHPSEVQHAVARALGVPDAAVTCECRRMGGGFGGKESQATQWAVIAALAARATGRACKLRLDRDDDFVMTGKRHDARVVYDVGFTRDGVVTGYDVAFLMRCGYSADLSAGVCDRTMFHADNAYHLGEVRITTKRLRTDTVSNTAFRGFGGPQGMVGVERVIDTVARRLGLDPLDVRKANL